MRSGDACGRDWNDGNRNSRSSSMTDGEVRYARDGEIATVIFDRPAARNAMTWRMYEQLGEACARIREEDGLRVAVFRGAGGKAFIAGTDMRSSERSAAATTASPTRRRWKAFSAASRRCRCRRWQ